MRDVLNGRLGRMKIAEVRLSIDGRLIYRSPHLPPIQADLVRAVEMTLFARPGQGWETDIAHRLGVFHLLFAPEGSAAMTTVSHDGGKMVSSAVILTGDASDARAIGVFEGIMGMGCEKLGLTFQ